MRNGPIDRVSFNAGGNMSQSPSTEKLAAQFDEAMHYRYAVEVFKATGHRPTRMLEMLETYGGVETVRRLMHQYAEYASEGYTRLWLCGRLDLLFEALMHDSQFHDLFTDDERAWARQRLAEYDYMLPK